jgi:hypothetical protein
MTHNVAARRTLFLLAILTFSGSAFAEGKQENRWRAGWRTAVSSGELQGPVVSSKGDVDPNADVIDPTAPRADLPWNRHDRAKVAKAGLVARATQRSATRASYRYLKQVKHVDVIVDLRPRTDGDVARQDAEAEGLVYYGVKADDTLEALTILHRETAAGRTVNVHSPAGPAKTGMVLAMFEASLHPRWSEDEAVQNARECGLQLFGQEAALRRFVRNLADGSITRRADGRFIKI